MIQDIVFTNLRMEYHNPGCGGRRMPSEIAVSQKALLAMTVVIVIASIAEQSRVANWQVG